jgi:two-component system KDP operon response regulator KdpE
VTRLLIVEDDEGIRIPLTRALEREGYGVDGVADGEAALCTATDGDHDLIIVDVGLPGMDGLEVCRRIRIEQPSVPILFLTAQDGELDIVDGLDAGADDYITKPFGMPEMLARLRAAARRAGAMARRRVGIVRTPDFVLDFGRKEAQKGEMTIRLTPTEWRLLEVLAAQAGTLVPQRELLQSVWGPGYGQEANYLRVYANRLRAKLEPDPVHPRYLKTEAGIGYRFDVSPVNGA